MKKILLVDDDESILDAVTLVLEAAEYEVEKTTRGEEVYERIASYKPDCILLDLLISGSDGRDICKNVKENPTTKHIPIVMISAHPTAEKEAITAGANDFLAKPFDAQTLLKKIESSFSL